MFNMMLDRLPTEYEGYLIRTDFRIGVQISLCLKDNELDEYEKTVTALSLLYGNGVPDDINVAVAGLNWFMSCGKIDERTSSRASKELFYFDFDAERIYSSFMVSYGIDLTKDKLHWFKFTALMGSLTKDCSFSQAVQIRDYDLKDLKGKARTDMIRLQRDLTPQAGYTDDEKEVMEKFDSLFDTGGDVNG